MGGSGEPHKDDGSPAPAQLEIQRVALGSPPQSLGENAQVDAKKRRVRETRVKGYALCGFFRRRT